jgi:FemAB-related protein (PEP-CTERM system-associated)
MHYHHPNLPTSHDAVDATRRIDVDSLPTLNEGDVRDWLKFLAPFGHRGMYCDPTWVAALCQGLGHRPYFLQARQGEQLVGVLPLAFISSRLFGRFLVSLPYVNWAGVLAHQPSVAEALVDEAVQLADRLDVRQLQLRHLTEVAHPALRHQLTNKVQMRASITCSKEQLWSNLRSAVRTQIRKARKLDLEVTWGHEELLDDFYSVFRRNMRDLGTPVFGRSLFEEILTRRAGNAELCVVRIGWRPIAAGLLTHGDGLSEVPSASALRTYRDTAANSLMYWHLLERAHERGQQWFDFGRSSIASPTFDFKRKWGTEPVPTVWQLYVRHGSPEELRPDSRRFRWAIRAWQHLPVGVASLIGPSIVRGIP